MRVLYIVGLGRSGSTLIDTILDSHTCVASLGGVRRLTHYASKRPCPCGAPRFADCTFWSRVDDALKEHLGRSTTTVDVHNRDHRTFAAHNQAVFAAAARVAGVETVVDNSKSLGRLRRLVRESELDVVPIHVVRDPRGRSLSLRKRGSRGILPTLTFTWRSLRIFAFLRKRPHIAVDYDRFSQAPAAELEKLMDRLDLPIEEGQLHWADQSHHNIGSGDILGSAHGSRIKHDTAFPEGLPLLVRAAVDVISWPGRLANRWKLEHWGCSRPRNPRREARMGTRMP